MNESKDVAKRICDQMFKTNPSMNFLESDIIEMADAIAALGITFAPVAEGSVKVRIAVAAIPSNGRFAVGCRMSRYSDGEPDLNFVSDEGDTHRGIVEAWIPRVAPVPTVAGRVVT